MNNSRRTFLKGSAAALGLAACHPLLLQAADERSPLHKQLRASVFQKHLLGPGKPPTEVWGFNDTVPGPLLRYRQGDRIMLEFVNDLAQDSTIHWHGLRIPNGMDGVPHVTQAPVKPGQSFIYEFSLIDSGTFWYHPHQQSFEQVSRGMYGALVVEELQPIEVDREVVWLISDFKLDAEGRQQNDFGRMKDVGGVGRIGNVTAINGQATGPDTILDVRAGERIRLRLLNCCTARIMSLKFEGHRPQVIAFDGQAVEPHTPDKDAVLLGPGMRVDLILDCMGAPGASFAITDAWSKNKELARIVYVQQSPIRSKPLGAPIALPGNTLEEPNVSKARRHKIVFQGGMSGQPVIGMVDGKPLKIQEMMEKHGLAWTMNLTAEHEHALMHKPFLHLKKGEHTIISMVNATGFEHPMHMHGHFFKVLSYNGKPPKRAEWRDTVLMRPRETVDIALVADNPGEWMFHCHILEHAAGGMMGTIRVG